MKKEIHESFKELKESAVKYGFQIYGNADGQGNRFETIYMPDQKYRFGLAYYFHGIDSQVLQVKNTFKIIIGFEETIMALDYDVGTELFHKETISPFYELLETKYCIIAVFELDIYVFDLALNQKWSSGFRDIIINHQILGDEEILIECANGDRSIISLMHGPK